MQNELPLVESAFGAALIGGGEIDVADPAIRRFACRTSPAVLRVRAARP